MKWKIAPIFIPIVLSGVLAGLSAAIVLITLSAATEYRENHPVLVWFLPLAGLLIGWSFHRYGRETSSGSNLVIEEIHEQKKGIPGKMILFAYLGTTVTHLFGGSAGREGTVVQMGAALAERVSNFFRLDASQRQTVLICGSGAAFGASMGAPLAGAIFGIEMLAVGKIEVRSLVESLFASFIAFGVVQLIGVPHNQYAIAENPQFGLKNFAYIFLAGIIFGLAARLFVWSVHRVEDVFERIKTPFLRPFFGGIALTVAFFFFGTHYSGLGLADITYALQHRVSVRDPLFKIGFTSLTLASGFKGGEFIPLVYIGTTLGSALSTWIPAPSGLLALVGFASVFGAAANTPLACALMAAEIFGYQIFPFAFLGCVVGYLVSGKSGIYKTQKRTQKKYEKIWPFGGSHASVARSRHR